MVANGNSSKSFSFLETHSVFKLALRVNHSFHLKILKYVCTVYKFYFIVYICTLYFYLELELF